MLVRGRPRLPAEDRIGYLQAGMKPSVRRALALFAAEREMSAAEAAGAMIEAYLRRHRPDLIAQGRGEEAAVGLAHPGPATPSPRG